MNQILLKWDIYEINSRHESLNGVMLRGRIRKLGIDSGFNVLAENTEDKENTVRFATLNSEDAELVISYVSTIISDVVIDLISSSTVNPVLSKIKVNDETRYTL